MRRRSPFKLLLSLLALPALVLFSSARAEGVAEDLRYEFIKINGVVHRFDRKSGDVEKLVVSPAGMTWTKADVPQAKLTAQPAPAVEPKTGAGDSAKTDPRPPKNASISIWDEKDNDITEVITDEDRKSARAVLESYQNFIGTISTTQVGERITGVLSVENKGARRIKVLEVTLNVQIVGREKPEEFHFLLIDKPGCTKPPQPAGANGDTAVLQKIDVPTPPGVLKGSPEFKVSYLKFTE